MPGTETRKPTLIVVSGAPATGKTTLTIAVTKALRMPYLGKDSIKESLFDSLGTKDREWSKKLGLASIELLFKLVDLQLEAGRGVVAECNYYKRLDVPRFERLRRAHTFRMVEVHCATDEKTMLERMRRRAGTPGRHAGHSDGDEEHARLSALLADGMFDPLGVADELIRVDTTDFGTVDYEAIASDVRAAMGQGHGGHV